MVPEPGQVRAQDRVQLVLDPIQVAGLRIGDHARQLGPAWILAQAQLIDRGEVPDQQGETFRPEWPRLVHDPLRETEQPDHRRMRIDLDARRGTNTPTLRRVYRPPESARQRRRTRRVELGTASVRRVRADLVPPECSGDLRLASSLPRLVRHDQRRVDRSNDNVASERSEPRIDLIIGPDSAGVDQPASVVDHGNARPRLGTPGQVDADEARQHRGHSQSVVRCPLREPACR